MLVESVSGKMLWPTFYMINVSSNINILIIFKYFNIFLTSNILYRHI